VAPGDTFAFPSGAAVAYETDGGSISSDGVFTAPAERGVHLITVTAPDGSSARVHVFVTYYIKGTVRYAGAQTGPIKLLVHRSADYGDEARDTGVLLDEPGDFIVRVLATSPDEWYHLRASLDGVAAGLEVQGVDPVGTNDAQLHGGKAELADVTLADPPPPTAPVPSVSVDVGDRVLRASAWLNDYPPAYDHVTIYWSDTPNPGPDNMLGSSTRTAQSEPHVYVPVDNDKPYYFSAVARAGSAHALGTAVSAAAHAGTGGLTIDGRLPDGAPVGVNYVLASGTFGTRIVRLDPEQRSFSFAGLGPSASDVQIWAFADRNGNGVYDEGESSSDTMELHDFNQSVSDLVLAPTRYWPPRSTFTTDRFIGIDQKDNITLRIDVWPTVAGTHSATAWCDGGVLAPFDPEPYYGRYDALLPLSSPPAGTHCHVAERTRDGLVHREQPLVVLDYPQLLTPVGDIGNSPTPLFSWTLSAGAKPQSLRVGWGTRALLWTTEPDPSASSIAYNADGRANTPTLTASPIDYGWMLDVDDAHGNTVRLNTEFRVSQ
jgi:hypothetical protein